MQLCDLLLEEANKIQSSVTTGQTLLELKESLQSTFGMEKRRDRRTSNSTRNQMEVQPTRSTSVWRSMGSMGWRDVAKKIVCSVGDQISHRGSSLNYFVYCRADSERKTVDSLTPVSSDVNDVEALTPHHFLLGNRNVCLSYLTCAEEFVDHRKLFRQTQAYANLIWDKFRKEYLPTLNNRQKWRSTSNEILKESDLVWLIEPSDKRGYYNPGRGANDGVYKRPVVKLASVLPGKVVFAIENRADDVVAELTNSITKLNSASRPFQAKIWNSMKSEI